MVLVTRCPHCETVFRVQDTQLARTRGRVRCGQCNEVFDALQNLLDPGAASAIRFGTTDEGKGQEPPAASTAPPAPIDRVDREPLPFVTPAKEAAASAKAEPEESAPTVQTPPSTFADIVADELREPTLESAATPPDVEGVQAPRGAPVASPPVETEHERAPTQAYAPPKPTAEKAEEPKLALGEAPNATWRAEREPREPRFSVPPSEPRTPPRFDAGPAAIPPAAQTNERVRPFEVTRELRPDAPRYAWLRVIGAFVALLLLVVFVAQLTWWRRETVMVYWPSSRSLFAEACTYLGCQISPPRDIDGLQVEASDLRQIDGPHRLELRVPLRNRYNIALAYPAIELTLFDEKNEVAIRRVLWPQDYAPPGTPIAAGLPPHATQTMIVRLDSGNAIATNFRVQIFYP